MKKFLSAIVLAMAVGALFSCSSPEPVDLANTALIPAPFSFQGYSGSPFILNSGTPIAYSDESLEKTVRLFADEMSKQVGITLAVENAASGKKSKSIFLELSNAIPALSKLPQPSGVSPKDGNPADEQYVLNISSKGIHISATAPEGIYRGLTSLRQLANGAIAEGGTIELHPVEVVDGPRFAWRSMSYDVSRYFSEIPEVKQVFDMLALYKFNTVHMHLTDNQGWRIEIKKYPLLTKVGGNVPNNGRKGGFYTQEEYKDLVQYAADRFITIVPEIDLPGHTASVFASYPDFKNAVNLSHLKLNIPGQALGALDPDDEKAMQFVQDVYTELAAMTPGSYIHIGGDETFGMPEEKFVKFINKAIPMVKAVGKKVVGWQETSRADIGRGDLFQHWINMDMDAMNDSDSQLSSMLPPAIRKILLETFAESGKDAERAVSKNAMAITAPSSNSYLDTPYKETSSDPSQEANRQRLGMRAYPASTVEEFYSWDPTTYNEFIRKENIAGVEAAIWCETIESFADLQFLVQPRLSGSAEKAWSHNAVPDWADYKIRLGAQSPIWNKVGWKFFKSSLVDWK